MAKADILLVLSISGEKKTFVTGMRADPPHTHTTLSVPPAFAALSTVERKAKDLADPTEASAFALAQAAVKESFPDSWSIAAPATPLGHVWRDGGWQPTRAAQEFGFAFRVTKRIPNTAEFQPYHGTLADGNAGYDLFVVVQSA